MKRKPARPKKATAAQVNARVEELLRIRLDGAEFWDVREYVREQEAEEGSPWYAGKAGRPLSDAQLYRYIARTDKLIAESCRPGRKRLLRRHLAQRRNLYAKAVSQGDVRAALAVLADEGRLLRLYDDPPAPRPTGELPTRPEAVVELLAARLAAVDRGRLPPAEQARLVTAVAAALLRAIETGDLEGRVREIEARLKAGQLPHEARSAAAVAG